MHRLALTVAGAAPDWRPGRAPVSRLTLADEMAKAPDTGILPFSPVQQKPARMGYSFSIDKELASLEQKIGLAAELCQRLRKENQELRQSLATAQQQVKQLDSKLQSAKSRLDSVIEKLPA